MLSISELYTSVRNNEITDEFAKELELKQKKIIINNYKKVLFSTLKINTFFYLVNKYYYSLNNKKLSENSFLSNMGNQIELNNKEVNQFYVYIKK